MRRAKWNEHGRILLVRHIVFFSFSTFTAKVSAFTAKVSAFTAKVSAFTAKVSAFTAKVSDFTAKVSAFTAKWIGFYRQMNRLLPPNESAFTAKWIGFYHQIIGFLSPISAFTIKESTFSTKKSAFYYASISLHDFIKLIHFFLFISPDFFLMTVCFCVIHQELYIFSNDCLIFCALSSVDI